MDRVPLFLKAAYIFFKNFTVFCHFFAIFLNKKGVLTFRSDLIVIYKKKYFTFQLTPPFLSCLHNGRID